MGIIRDYLAAPELQMMIAVLWGYVVLYLAVAIASRVFIAMRRGGTKPPIDRIVHVSTFWLFVLLTILPLFVIGSMIVNQQFSNAWYFLPYGVVALVNVFIIIRLFGKRNPSMA